MIPCVRDLNDSAFIMCCAQTGTLDQSILCRRCGNSWRDNPRPETDSQDTSAFEFYLGKLYGVLANLNATLLAILIDIGR